MGCVKSVGGRRGRREKAQREASGVGQKVMDTQLLLLGWVQEVKSTMNMRGILWSLQRVLVLFCFCKGALIRCYPRRRKEHAGSVKGKTNLRTRLLTT